MLWMRLSLRQLLEQYLLLSQSAVLKMLPLVSMRLPMRSDTRIAPAVLWLGTCWGLGEGVALPIVLPHTPPGVIAAGNHGVLLRAIDPLFAATIGCHG